MQPIIQQGMTKFLNPEVNEEIIDQPLYHFQTYAAAGATSLSFFNTAVGSATNGLADTNMDTASQLSIGKRAAIMGISVVFIPGEAPVVGQTTTANAIPQNAWNDLKAVMDGVAYLQLTLLEKVYYVIAPLSYLPAGFGSFGQGGGLVNNQTTAANNSMAAVGATNGLPLIAAARRLKAPLPIPSQMRFSVDIKFPTAIAVSAAGRIGVVLDCLQIRAKQ